MLINVLSKGLSTHHGNLSLPRKKLPGTLYKSKWRAWESRGCCSCRGLCVPPTVPASQKHSSKVRRTILSGLTVISRILFHSQGTLESCKLEMWIQAFTFQHFHIWTSCNLTWKDTAGSEEAMNVLCIYLHPHICMWHVLHAHVRTWGTCGSHYTSESVCPLPGFHSLPRCGNRPQCSSVRWQG